MTFSNSKSYSGFLNCLENLVQMFDVILECQGKNYYVIDVDQSKYPKEWCKNILHYSLENTGTILISERHLDKLPQSSMSPESQLLVFRFFDFHLSKSSEGIKGRQPFAGG